MSKLLTLSGTYGSFFWGCTKFAVSPYTQTFKAIATSGNHNDPVELITNSIAAGVVCGMLTFVVPVLPVIAAFTFFLASIAMLLAVSTMFITYPIALIADGCALPSEDDLLACAI